ncbi:hypothetical protein AWB77_03041 [Caballeronia fortuita]|uniref:Glycosyltransferase RgtA/B/C/D-like domain-containing protein n=1 Tax=Caballeronia fortuita TaxID=1777138 RepID=A0A158BNC0_9BURK|nr:hypothetical protein [Caballeronia fortuita]SAK71602.1 hypothetical protein AWB77_03041 [Caballeronia fortuita]
MNHTLRFDAARKALLYVSASICAMMLAAYVTIIGRSYFFQDDFQFWPVYATIKLSALFDPATNFGRPVTRDLYFYLVSHLLGMDSSNFFYFNLAIIAGVCVFIYRMLRAFELDPVIAAAAAAIYFYMPPTIPHASWISNSQHTIAHLFSFWFIAAVVRGVESGSVRIIRAALVYLLAMFSNVSSLFALIFVGIYLLLRHRRASVSRFIPLMATLGVLAACTIAWSLAISHSAPVYYKPDLSLAHSIARAHYYDDLLSKGMIGAWYRLLFAAVIALTVVNLRRNYLLTLPLAGAFVTAFAMLFFLGDQRTLGYLAIPYIALALMLFGNYAAPVWRAHEWRSPILLSLSFLFIFYSTENGTPYRNDFMSSPYGAGIRDVQNAVRNVRIAHDTTFCFAPDRPPRDPGVAPFWLFLGSGSAFSLVDYGDTLTRQFLYYTDPRCVAPDVVRVAVSQSGSIVAVTGIAMPK